MEYESDGDANCNWCTWYRHQRISKGTKGLENKSTSRDHPDYSIKEITQNTKKDSGDLCGLTVTQTPVSNHQLELV